MELIYVVSLAFTVLALVFIPCAILSFGMLLVLGIDDRFVNPVVAYIVLPEAVVISGYLFATGGKSPTSSSRSHRGDIGMRGGNE